jgi:hypothetical protein
MGVTMSRKTEPLSREFVYIGEAGVDERKRVSLTKVFGLLKARLGSLGEAPETLHFRVYINDAGQVLLDPAVSVPIHEIWLYRNPEALAKVREGLAQSAKGEVHDLGSFDKFADDEIE